MDFGAYNRQPGTGNQTTIEPVHESGDCGLRRSQLSVLHAIIPDLQPDNLGLPRGAADLGDSYVLLRARDETCVTLTGQQADRKSVV